MFNLNVVHTKFGVHDTVVRFCLEKRFGKHYRFWRDAYAAASESDMVKG